MGFDATCIRCILQLSETPSHCFWICPVSDCVARAAALLLWRAGIYFGYLMWGVVSWLMRFRGRHLFFEGADLGPVFMLIAMDYQQGVLSMIPSLEVQDAPHVRDEVFCTLVSITLSNVWRGGCRHILSAAPSTSSNILSDIWVDTIHTLRSQWNASNRHLECSREA
ncbi:hypothetical protein L7F22_036251 [Adiantum nelumboides]|nr:hypothetical protein [Adiantum nelumboides]